MKKNTIFNKEADFTEKIKPKLDEIKQLCIRYDVPYIVVFATENTDQETLYKMDGLMPGVKNIKLADNRLNEVFKIISGYTQLGNIDVDNDISDDFPEEI